MWNPTKLVLCCLLSCATINLWGDEGKIQFNEAVRPILNQHCIACHGGVKQAGDLSFVYGDQAAYVVEPGDPDSSEIILRVMSEDPEERMPPPDHGKSLTASEVETLRQWIREGGEWGKHWAFDPPKNYRLDLPDDDWSRQPIDPFVLEGLRKSGLKSAPEASPERWLRRTTLNLTGLPPTLAERRRFLADVAERGELAYATAVDRLLESSAFGERWASVWLDAVRYADSKGLGIDGRRTIWKYRDWVIQALNNDMPYDQFTIKQLAGDLLPSPSIGDQVATACHRLTQTCEEGGTDDEQFRVEAVIDRVNTTMQAWQGLTFGCVQCHAHPYDPIRHEEYYQFLAFFNNTADSDLDNEEPRLQVPRDDSDYPRAAELDQQLKSLNHTLWQAGFQLLKDEEMWSALPSLSASTNNSTKVVAVDVEGVAEYQTRGNVAKETTVILEASLPEGFEQLTALRFTGLPEDEASARIDSEWGFVVSHLKAEILDADGNATELPIAAVVADEPDPILDPKLSLNAKSKSGFGAFSRIHYPRSAAFVLKEPKQVGPDVRVRVSVRQDIFALGAFPLVAHRGRLEVSASEQFSDWIRSEERQYGLDELAHLKKQRDAIESVPIPIFKERYAAYTRSSFVFDRGNYLNKSDPVSARTPGFLPEMNCDVPTRLELAQWLVGKDNPLTARVAVNRIWAQMFGTGLVETQEDFGSSGDPPSHPRLLDDLAARFQTDMGWSVKSLLRELTLSSTYRQSAVVDAKKLDADPRNRLLSRGPRQRLPAETIRDQTLALSGLLSKKQFGEPVHPPIPEGVWMPFQGGDKWSTPKKGDPNRYRRTVYTYTKRTIQFPMQATFDAPTREFCSPRRLPSNTPLQALMAMNDTLFVEAGEALAERMQKHAPLPRKQIRFGFTLATCRAPTAQELQRLLSLYQSSLSAKRPSADATSPTEGVASNVKDTDTEETNAENAGPDPEVAALELVAGVLLNLDEVLSQ